MTERTLRLVVEYDGARLCGFQRQDNGRSVQGEIEAALLRLTGAAHTVRGAGRTDAGVHAVGQVVSFRTQSRHPPEVFLRGLNAHLPEDIAVREASEAAPEFDARHSASGKLYRYRIWNAPARSPLLRGTHYHVRGPLDLAAMQAAAEALQGRHDFAAFRAADCGRRTTVRLVRRVWVSAPAPGEVHVEVEATAFLKNMVRILVGTLVQVGQGKRDLESVRRALASGRRTDAGPTAPAHGLTLVRVDYGPRTGP